MHKEVHMDPGLRREIHTLHAQICAGLADPNRILILYALDEAPRYVTELSEILETPQPTISRHLKVLRDRGLVHGERDGQSVNYSVGDPRIIQALDLMRAVLSDQLRSQAELVENAMTRSQPSTEVRS
jgi:ArsR family transcriptional regulator